VHEHVHAADAQHGGVEVVAVEHAVVEVLPLRGVGEHAGVLLAQMLRGGDKEPRRTRGGVRDFVRGLRVDHRHHQLDDVPRSAELAVDPGAGDLSQQVLIQVAGGVAVLHRDVVKHVHHTGQQLRGWDGEAGILHMFAVGRPVPAEGAEERENLRVDDLEHLAGLIVLEHRPSQLLPIWAEAQGLRPAGAARLLLSEGVQIVEPADEKQIGDLLDNLEWIGDTPGPEGIPNSVDLALQLPSDQLCLPLGLRRSRDRTRTELYTAARRRCGRLSVRCWAEQGKQPELMPFTCINPAG
jgi:hypothetical protein